MVKRRGFLGFAATGLAAPAAAAVLPRPALAQANWPTRPVRLIVGWPPGGSVDTIARILQPRWQEALGQPIVIDNKGGASGSIGAAEAARAMVELFEAGVERALHTESDPRRTTEEGGR